MNCNLYIADEYAQIEKNLGSIPLSVLKDFVDLASNDELHYLSGIDCSGETIFNPLQLFHLKQNLVAVQQVPYVNQNKFYLFFLDAIEKALKEGSYTYLKIICTVAN